MASHPNPNPVITACVRVVRVGNPRLQTEVTAAVQSAESPPKNLAVPAIPHPPTEAFKEIPKTENVGGGGGVRDAPDGSRLSHSLCGCRLCLTDG